MFTAIVAICAVLLSLKIYLKLNKLWNSESFVWLTDKQWAVVTGSTDGIGFEFARQLAFKGYNLMLISRNEGKLKATREKILTELNSNERLRSVEICTLTADFTCSDVYDKIEPFLNVQTNSIYVLVNNVGVCPPYPKYFTDQSTADHLDMINVNVLAATRMIQMVLPSMAAKKRGLVVNVSSIAARHLFSLSSLYSATKAYIGHLSECLALEYRDRGITFCTLYPSAVSTKMIHNARQDFMTVSPERYVQSALDSIRYRQSVHITGYWAHSLLELLINAISVQSSREFVGTIIERCSLGYQSLVMQMEQRHTEGIDDFHMWNVLTQRDPRLA